MYQIPIKSKYPIRTPSPKVSLFSGTNEVSLLLAQLQGLKQSFEVLLKNAENQLSEHKSQAEDATNKVVQTVNQANKILEETTKQALAIIKERATPGKNAEPIDQEEIVQKLKAHIPEAVNVNQIKEDILSKIPKTDEKKLLKRFLKAIPQNKASLKVIQESFTTDPMSVIEKIMELAKEGKFKLKKENIDGLEQTLASFNSQLGKGYLHGGGTTVVAGTNITLVKNPDGTTTINASGGGFTLLNTASTVDGSNQSFVFSTATAQPSLVVVDGAQLTAVDNKGVTQWSWNPGTKTVTLSTPPPTNSIFAYQ